MAERTLDASQPNENPGRQRHLIKRVVDLPSAFVMALGGDGTIQLMNACMLSTLGYTEDEVLGRDYQETFVPEADRELVSGTWQRIAELRRPEMHEAHVLTKDRRELLVEWLGVPVDDENGEFDFLMGMGLNITECWRTDEQLRLQAAALESVDTAVAITNREGTVSWINPAFTDLIGYTSQDIVDKNLRVLKSDKQDAEFYRNLWETISSGQVWRDEIINRRKDGSLYVEEMTITPILDPYGDITNFIAIKQDVSERKELQEQFLQSQKMESVGRLAGGVAHDFNNILTGIMGYCQLATMRLPPGNATRVYLREIQQSAERAAKLTHQLLAFSRRQFIEPRVLNLSDVHM